MSAVGELMDAIPTLLVKTHLEAGNARVTMGGIHTHLMHVYPHVET